MATILPQADGIIRLTAVTEMQFTAIVTVADDRDMFPAQQARQEPTQVYAQELSHAITEIHRSRTATPFVAQTMPNVYMTVPAAHAIMLHATGLQTSVHATTVITKIQSAQTVTQIQE